MSDQAAAQAASQATNEAAEATDTALEAGAAEGATGESDSGQTVAPAKTAKQAKKIEKQLKKLKLKIDGQEFEEEFDPNDDEYMTRQLQMARVAQKRMQEKAEMETQVVAFIEQLKTNPRKALSNPNIGVDVKELAARIIEEEIAESKKSPEQIEKERLQEEIRMMKEAQEKEKKDREAVESQRLLEQEYERIDIQIDQALSKTDLPKEPYVVKKIADYMLVSAQAGKDVTPDDVLPLVREEIINDIKHLASVLPEDTLAEIFGDVVKKLRKTNIAKAKAKQAVGSNKTLDVAQKGKQGAAEPAKKKTFKEFFGV